MKNQSIVCLGCCCPQKGGFAVEQKLIELAAKRDDLSIRASGCMGPCSKGPNIIINGKLHSWILAKDLFAVNVGIYHAPSQTLIFSDIHLGYEHELHRKGILVPHFQFADEARIIKLILAILHQQKCIPKTVVLNGDLKHSFGAISRQEWDEVLGLVDCLRELGFKVIFVRGNHDKVLDQILKKRDVQAIPFLRIQDLLILHGDELPKTNQLAGVQTILMGHEHPAITLRDNAKAERFKCFLRGTYKHKTLIVQPSLFPLVQGTDVLQGTLLSPLLKKGISQFNVFVVDEKTSDVLDFGKVKRSLNNHRKHHKLL